MQLVKKIWDVAEDFRPVGKPIMTATKDFDDAMDGGVRGGELVTLSGQSGIGKTSYALWLTKKLNDSGIPVLWFTYEMNPWYLKEKLEKLGGTEDMNIYVPIDHNGKSVEWIEERIKEGIEKYACKVVFIDHLHYLIPTNQEMNSSLLIGGIARKLKTLAVKTDSIIFLIAHMKRLMKDEKVTVDAIRDSALIANESDYVYLIERLKRKDHKGRLDSETIDDANLYTEFSRITLGKNRRTGNVFYRIFEYNRGAFEEVAKERYSYVKQEAQL